MNEDWLDLFTALLEAEVRFLIVGAHAMGVHGVPRATQDIDVWIDSTPINAQRVFQVLAEFGAPLRDLKIGAEDFARPDQVIQIGLPPNRIDILTSISGIDDFHTAWEGRVEHGVRGRPLPFLGRETLIRNKRASGRLKDLADLEALGEKT